MINLLTNETAPAPSRATLAIIEKTNGFIPNLFRALAGSPTSLNGFAGLVAKNDDGTLSPAERQIVQMVASVENNGSYCVAGHSVFSENVGLDDTVIESVREGMPLHDRRYQALAELTRALMRTGGKISPEQIDAFTGIGFEQEQILEVIIGIALKTVTNYVSGAFDLPLDAAFQHQAWTSEQTRPAEATWA